MDRLDSDHSSVLSEDISSDEVKSITNPVEEEQESNDEEDSDNTDDYQKKEATGGISKKRIHSQTVSHYYLKVSHAMPM